MPNEYDDPVHPNTIEAAIALTIRLGAQSHHLNVADLARQAVDELFCTCVTTAADAVANGEAPVHAGLIAEVRQQAQRRAIDSAAGTAGDAIDLASEQSFPASDSPAWIWR